jgi:hypothetical protein
VLPKTWCTVLHRDCSWMHLMQDVWRVQCMVCGSSTQATRFLRAQVVIAARMSSSKLRKHYQSYYQAIGRRWAQDDQACPANVQLALLRYVGPWPIIVNELSIGEKNLWLTSLKASWISRNAQLRPIQYAMTKVMASLFVNIQPSKDKLTLFRNGNCFLIASTVRAYSLR